MKNTILFIVLTLTGIFFTDCTPADELAGNLLEGTWKITSYKDATGLETIDQYTQFDMIYYEYDHGNSIGDFTWTTTDAPSGPTESTIGDYRIYGAAAVRGGGNVQEMELVLRTSTDTAEFNVIVEDDKNRLIFSNKENGDKIVADRERQ